MLAWLVLALAVPFDALATNGIWSSLPDDLTPSPRKLTGLVFDPVRDRLIAIGGYPGPLGDVWTQPLTGAPLWSRLNPAGVAPTARFAHSTIYQPGQDRVILFGGFDTAFRNDVWALSLSGFPTWTRLTPSGTPPPARWAHVAVYDAPRNRMVIFGGYDGSVSRNDVWALSLGASPTWTQITPAGPLPNPRTNVAGVYDEAGDRLLVFGGFNTATQDFNNETWVLPLAPGGAWVLLSPRSSLPTRRRDHSMVYAAGKVVMFGGSYATPLDDVHVLNLSPVPAWTQVVPAGTRPPARFAHRAVYDAPRDRMVIFGGEDVGFLNDTWALSLNGSSPWVSLDDARRSINAPRRNFGMTNAGGAMVLFGGEGPDLRDDTAKLKLTATPAWDAVAPATRPTARSGHHAIFDAPRNRVLIFGGFSGIFLNDVHAYSPATDTWQPVVTSGTPPSPRVFYGMVYDPVRQRMLVIGGHPSFMNDVWALNLSGSPVWTQLSPAGAPPSPRFYHSAIYQPGLDRVIVFGGFDGSYRNDVWALSLSGTPTWTPLSPSGVPPAGRQASAVVYDAVRNRMVVFGGYNGTVARNDVWALSLGATPQWTQLTPAGVGPSPRANMEGIYDAAHDRMIVKAGFDPGSEKFFGDTWVLTWDSPTPALVSLVSARGERGVARVTWQVSDGDGAQLTAWRRSEASGWTAMGELVPDGQQKVTLEDCTVAEGARYGYRLGIREGTTETFAGEVWLDIPRAAKLSLAGPRPNPAAGSFGIALSLADESTARLELFDTAGRSVFARDVGSLGAGDHEVRIERALANGLYFARLRQHGRVLTCRVLIAR